MAESQKIRWCRYLADAQREEELDSAQLWAFPLFLRIVLIEELTDLAYRLSRAQQLREAAFLWADRMAHSSRNGREALQQVVQRLHSEVFARDPTFLTALAEQLQDQETCSPFPYGRKPRYSFSGPGAR